MDNHRTQYTLIPLILRYTSDPRVIASKLNTKELLREYLDTTHSIEPVERLDILNETMEGFLVCNCKFHAEYTREYIENLNLKYLMN